jgi:hypothetical protein
MSNTTDQKTKGQGWFSRSDLEAKVKALESELAAAKAAPVPEAAARLVEQATRRTAQDLSATRRASDNTLTRAEFNALKPADQAEFLQGKGTIVDGPVQAKTPVAGAVTADAFKASIAPKSMPRAEFDKLNHPERNAWIKQGGKLHD